MEQKDFLFDLGQVVTFNIPDPLDRLPEQAVIDGRAQYNNGIANQYQIVYVDRTGVTREEWWWEDRLKAFHFPEEGAPA